MRDLYWPHVGMLNHIGGHRNAIGVWVDGNFSWIDHPGWNRTLGYRSETLVTDCSATHPRLRIRLQITDAVHFREDLYLKRIQVTNLDEESAREVRLFFNHDFSIDQTDIGDTALYDLGSDAMIHYKRDKCFCIGGQTGHEGIFQYSTGTKRFAGAEGTWRDAEDGWLEGNAIAQGSVDSCMSFRMQLPAGGAEYLEYWMAIGPRFEDVQLLHRLVQERGVENLTEETARYWIAWVNKRPRDYKDLPPVVVDLFKRSLLIVRTQTDQDGAILAANDSDILQFNRDTYSYVWPRDAALVAWALDLAGYPEITRRFYQFSERILSPGGFLWHKYHPDGSVGSSWHPWVVGGETQLPIQEDETALVLAALAHFYDREPDMEMAETLYEPLVRRAGDFLAAYRDPKTLLPLPSYDLWEERRGVFTFTCATVYAGLLAAARFATLFGQERSAQHYRVAAEETRQAVLSRCYSPTLGRFLRGWIQGRDGTLTEDPTLESSLFAVWFFGLLPPRHPWVVGTMKAIQEGLWVKTPVGGIARYSRDYYFHKTTDFSRVPGNPWPITTLWLADWYVAAARTAEELRPARRLLRWVTTVAMETGVIPEQVHPETGAAVSVAPLTWSHSTFAMVVLRYLHKIKALEQRQILSAAWHAAPGSG